MEGLLEYLKMLEKYKDTQTNPSESMEIDYTNARPFSGNLPSGMNNTAYNAAMARGKGMDALAESIPNLVGNPDPSFWDKFTSGIDRDFVAAVAGSFGGQASGGRVGAKFVGGNDLTHVENKPVTPNITSLASNPGMKLNQPRRLFGFT
tara:strand:+ start:873 stop:1319 length:447 start_codon:yes stop_codon:yes gene_type:complete